MKNILEKKDKKILVGYYWWIFRISTFINFAKPFLNAQYGLNFHLSDSLNSYSSNHYYYHNNNSNYYHNNSYYKYHYNNYYKYPYHEYKSYQYWK